VKHGFPAPSLLPNALRALALDHSGVTGVPGGLEVSEADWDQGVGGSTGRNTAKRVFLCHPPLVTSNYVSTIYHSVYMPCFTC
jgi:hypothetical protein